MVLRPDERTRVLLVRPDKLSWPASFLRFVCLVEITRAQSLGPATADCPSEYCHDLLGLLVSPIFWRNNCLSNRVRNGSVTGLHFLQPIFHPRIMAGPFHDHGFLGTTRYLEEP